MASAGFTCIVRHTFLELEPTEVEPLRPRACTDGELIGTLLPGTFDDPSKDHALDSDTKSEDATTASNFMSEDTSSEDGDGTSAPRSCWSDHVEINSHMDSQSCCALDTPSHDEAVFPGSTAVGFAPASVWFSHAHASMPMCFMRVPLPAESWHECTANSMVNFKKDKPTRRPGCQSSTHFVRPKVEPGVRTEATTKPAGRTTLVFKNLPEGSTRESFRRLVDDAGFRALYDFLYIPVSFKTWKFFAYAFVNFELHEDAGRCWHAFQDDTVRQDMCVMWCEEHQGINVHIGRYRNSPIMHRDVSDEYKPILLAKGRRAKFPPPTKCVRPPRSLPMTRAC